MLIFKIVPAAEWEAAQQADVYAGSAHDKADGFLHFSTAPQLRETLARYYRGAKDLMLVAVIPDSLAGHLKWEHSPSRGEDFPHLYAPLPLSAVKWARPIAYDAAGEPVLSDLA